MGVADHTTAPRRSSRGRGHVSRIDILRRLAADDVEWMEAQLRTRRLPQTAILSELNTRLAAKGLEAISVGTFSRHSLRLAGEMRHVAAGIGALAGQAAQVGGNRTLSPAIELARATLLALLLDNPLYWKAIQQAANSLVDLLMDGPEPADAGAQDHG